VAHYTLKCFLTIISVLVGVSFRFIHLIPDDPAVTGLGKRYAGATVTNSTTFSAYELGRALIAVVPGVEFGNDAHIRISYATSMHNLGKGLDRMAEAAAAAALC